MESSNGGLTAAQKARIERNRQRAQLLRESKVAM